MSLNKLTVKLNVEYVNDNLIVSQFIFNIKNSNYLEITEYDLYKSIYNSFFVNGNNSLNYLKKWFYETFKYNVNLNFSFIKYIDHKIFTNLNVIKLTFSIGEVETFYDTHSCDNINSISYSDFKNIKSLKYAKFCFHTNVKSLSFDKVGFSQIMVGDLGVFKNLTVLTLFNCPLVEIESNIFDGLVALLKLSITCCYKLEKINGSKLFQYCNNIRLIDFSNNSIDHINSLCFYKLHSTNCLEIDLSSNKLKSVNFIFPEQNLSKMFLRNNPIKFCCKTIKLMFDKWCWPNVDVCCENIFYTDCDQNSCLLCNGDIFKHI